MDTENVEYRAPILRNLSLIQNLSPLKIQGCQNPTFPKWMSHPQVNETWEPEPELKPLCPYLRGEDIFLWPENRIYWCILNLPIHQTDPLRSSHFDLLRWLQKQSWSLQLKRHPSNAVELRCCLHRSVGLPNTLQSHLQESPPGVNTMGWKEKLIFWTKASAKFLPIIKIIPSNLDFRTPHKKNTKKKNYYIYSCGLEDRICKNLWVYRYQGTNALSVDWTCCTFTNWCCTKLQSPPSRGSPQHTTEPSIRIAANALRLAWICWTFPGENKWLGGWTSLSELTAKSGTPKQMMRTHEKVRFFVVRCCRIISLLLRIESQSQCWDSEPARFHWKFLVTSEGISQLNQLKRVELGGSHCPNYPFFTVIRLC